MSSIPNERNLGRYRSSNPLARKTTLRVDGVTLPACRKSASAAKKQFGSRTSRYGRSTVLTERQPQNAGETIQARIMNRAHINPMLRARPSMKDGDAYPSAPPCLDCGRTTPPRRRRAWSDSRCAPAPWSAEGRSLIPRDPHLFQFLLDLGRQLKGWDRFLFPARAIIQPPLY